MQIEDHPLNIRRFIKALHTSGGASYFWPGKKDFFISSSSSSSSPFFFFVLVADFFAFSLSFFSDLEAVLDFDFDFLAESFSFVGVLPLFRETFFFLGSSSESSSESSFCFLTFFLDLGASS